MIAAPFAMAVARFAATGFRCSAWLRRNALAEPQIEQAAAIDFFAILPLMVFELLGVTMTSPGGPMWHVGLAWCGIPYVVYVAMRIAARQVWEKAVDAAGADSATAYE